MAKAKISLDEIRRAATPSIPPCGLAEFMKKHLSPDEIQTVYRALEDHSIKGVGIYSVLKERGYTQDRQVVWHHRERACRRCMAMGYKPVVKPA